ncbi:pectate lyase [Microbulbifer bruguierae]|uniref:Pectate lyase n=1 Tax=Microbulbifer bruguierae TaxID=3029061 RepID=A0ABY8NHE7_9GAMM|nr:pectate lyase [Microbulbifer bruguierae]WGL16953.1 pectate lyase [Microbulbifer bruguierae]
MTYIRRKFLVPVVGALLAGFITTASAEPEKPVYQPISIDGFYDAIKHWNDRTGEEGIAHYPLNQIESIADNLLLYQRDSGGWPTNKHPLRVVSSEERAQANAEKSLADASFDNRNIYPQIEYLSEVYRQTGNTRYRDAALKGLHYTLDRQYPNGGWAHSPDRTERAYYRHITIADEVMPGVLAFLRKVASGDYPFDYIDEGLRNQTAQAVTKGNMLLLDLQVRIDGKRTGWAGQYHEGTLKPAQGRSYELPGVLAWETVPVLQYLMSIDNPSAEIIEAVNAGAAWLEFVKLSGFRVDRVDSDHRRFDYHAADYDLVVVDDSKAKPIWARFYDLKTSKPFLANRDGKRVYRLSDVDADRRTGYSWYGYWPASFLESEYPAWQQKTAIAAQLDRFHQAASDADSEGYFNLFSKDGVFLGTDATERWSVAEFKQYAKPYFDQGKGWTYVPRDRTIVLHGDVAWFDELLDNASYGECRGSGVLVREDGQWKIAQYNLHFPIPNDLADQITKMIKESQAK